MKKKKPVNYLNVIYKIEHNYFPSRWSIYPSEFKAVELALAGNMITNKKTLLLLKEFGFNVM